MKGIIMFDNLNDLAFFDVDYELSEHLQSLALKDGLLEVLPFKSVEGIVDKNVVMQLFSPLIASYKVMQAQFGNKYKYIEAEDGVLLVFEEILNYIVISISRQEEKLGEIQQELSLFLVIVKMLYGPSLHTIKNDISSCSGRVLRSELLSKVLNNWRKLKMEQQMFLVEAVERLIINQDITAMCINLLQEVLEKVRRAYKDGIYSHAFALVDTKLLALYSSRNSSQLPKETLLLLILFVQVLKNTSVIPLNVEDTDQNSDDEFFIPISSSTSNKDLLTDENKAKSSGRNATNNNDSHYGNLKTGAHTLLIYLQSRTGSLVPHIIYVIEVTNRITFVILNEVTDFGFVSSCIEHLVKALQNLQSHPISRDPLTSFESLEAEFRSLIDAMCKMKALEDKEKHLKKLIGKWEQLKQSDIEAFFQMPKEQSVNPRLDSALSSLCEILRILFEDIVASPCLLYEEKSCGSEHQEFLKFIQKLSTRRIKDVANFLEVKAVQNITMASYIAEFPGLIHFIYVDRSCDCLIAPAVNLRKGHLSGATSLKHKIWKMVSFGRRYVNGVHNFCSLWKEDDLLFFYHIWFEDSAGRVIKPTAYPSLKKFPRKGIICGNFYKKLVEQCFPGASYEHIFCYEFFCVHLESTPTEVIVDHSRRLCAQLWSFTGASRTSLDLL